MRPLLVNFSWGFGGLEMTTATVFRRLRARGIDVEAVVQAASPLAKRFASLGEPDRVTEIAARKYFDPRALRALRRVIVERDRDVVHTFWSADLFHAAQVLVGLRRVGLVHHLQMLPSHPRKDPLKRLLYRRIDRLLTITRQIEERVKVLWPVAPSRVRTLYYGLELEGPERGGGGRRAARERMGLAADGPVFGLVGQVCELKGQQFVLDAFAALAAEMPEARLVFAGAVVNSEPEYAAALERRIGALGLEGRVVSLGFRDDVPELLPGIDYFVLGSRSEPFGLVVIEAMAAGCVMIASAAGGIPEIVTDGEDGFLYESRDLASLVAVMRDVARRAPEELDLVRARARERVRTRFGAARFTDEVLAVYSEVIAAREPGAKRREASRR